MRLHLGLTAAAAAIAAFGAAPAMAQVEAPFTGPHVEALLGYDNLSGGDDGIDDSSDGLLYGVGAGFDFQVGRFIAGVEGEWTDSTTRIRGNNIDVAGDRFRINTDRDLYAGVRVGLEAAPGTLVYLKGGYTNARLEARYTSPIAGDSFSENANLDGYRIGAGIERKFALFGPSGFVKAEYRYSNYSNADLGDDVDANVDVDRHQVLAGVGVRF